MILFSHQMDKASVLGDAVKYVKQLQERLKKLEEEVSRKTVESVVLVKKSQVSADEDTSSSDENSCSQSDQKLPEIEARVSGKHVLIRVHCERHQGCVSKILNLIETLNLSVLSNSVVPFGSSILDITVVAQVSVLVGHNLATSYSICPHQFTKYRIQRAWDTPLYLFNMCSTDSYDKNHLLHADGQWVLHDHWGSRQKPPPGSPESHLTAAPPHRE